MSHSAECIVCTRSGNFSISVEIWLVNYESRYQLIYNFVTMWCNGGGTWNDVFFFVVACDENKCPTPKYQSTEDSKSFVWNKIIKWDFYVRSECAG